MKRVLCEVEYTTLVGDYSDEVEGVTATCPRCGHETEAYGSGENSIKRCLMALREECPRRERNFYVDSDEANR